jgi:hypothetical protein
VDWAEWTISIVLTLMLAGELTVRARHSGPLWRDECGAVQLAQQQSLRQVWEMFPHEAFPMLFPLTIRSYTAIAGSSDFALRALGITIGAGMVAAFWLSAFWLNRQPPLLVLVLAGLNTNLLYWGTTIRGYGLGTCWILLALGLLARVYRHPRLGSIVAAFFASCISVHYLLFNLPLLAAVGGSWILVALRRQRMTSAVAIALICLGAAGSMIPYGPSYLEAAKWNSACKTNVDMAFLGEKIWWAMRAPTRSMGWIWLACLVAAMLLAVGSLFKQRHAPPSQRRDCLAFGGLAIMLSLMIYFCFLLMLSYPTQVWHYIPLLCVLALCMDLIVQTAANVDWLRWGRMICIVILAPLMCVANTAGLRLRQTNIDVAARLIDVSADREDLVLVIPWFLGISFNRYDRGSSPWETVPPLDDHRMHRYDLVQKWAASPENLKQLTDRIDTHLKAGKRVWIVGLSQGHFLSGTRAMLPCPAHPTYAEYYAYLYSLAGYLGTYLGERSASLEEQDLTADFAVHPFEDVAIWTASGWETPSPEPARISRKIKKGRAGPMRR